MTTVEVLLLLAWGTVVGLDLVSVPQVMVARPLVAGAGAGAVLGDLPTGLMIGMLLELFQYDVLPVGAARYPEYGPASVAAVAAATLVRAAPPVSAAVGAAGLGLGALVGFGVALIGGWSLHAVRRVNARAVRGAAAALEQGDAAVLMRVHLGGIGRDAVRAAAVTALGLGAAWAVGTVLPGTLGPRGAALVAAAAVGAAIAAAAAGAMRLVGPGLRRSWLAVGLLSGIAVGWLR